MAGVQKPAPIMVKENKRALTLHLLWLIFGTLWQHCGGALACLFGQDFIDEGEPGRFADGGAIVVRHHLGPRRAAQRAISAGIAAGLDQSRRQPGHP